MELPRYVALKSMQNNKYLVLKKDALEFRALGLPLYMQRGLQFSGDKVASPYAKYEVQLAKTGNGLVHIRCCYNNKYWVTWGVTKWIVAGADEPEEDQSNPWCTLFKPVYVGTNKAVRFCHVQSQKYLISKSVENLCNNYLCAESGEQHDEDHSGVCFVTDWESLLILPKYIAFKGDNGCYLSAVWVERHPYLQFSSNDIGDPSVGNQVFTTPDGSVRIKSNYHGKFWRRSPNWIWSDSDDPTGSKNDPDTLFWPVKVDNNVIALRNLGNNYYCKRLTTEHKVSCLNAAVPTISKEARLEVEEIVFSRSIYNVEFRLEDARIYDQSVLTMANGDAINRTQEPNTVDVQLSYSETKSSTWNSSVSLKLGVRTSFKTGAPIIADGKVLISAEFSGEYQWGESRTSTSEVKTVYKVIVPPMTCVKVYLLATKGTCDVPFSYTQRDTLTNGQQVTDNMDDGIYTGINCFNFKYETKQQSLLTEQQLQPQSQSQPQSQLDEIRSIVIEQPPPLDKGVRASLHAPRLIPGDLTNTPLTRQTR